MKKPLWATNTVKGIAWVPCWSHIRTGWSKYKKFLFIYSCGCLCSLRIDERYFVFKKNADLLWIVLNWNTSWSFSTRWAELIHNHCEQPFRISFRMISSPFVQADFSSSNSCFAILSGTRALLFISCTHLSPYACWRTPTKGSNAVIILTTKTTALPLCCITSAHCTKSKLPSEGSE